jgi:NADPH2:quinone reductase
MRRLVCRQLGPLDALTFEDVDPLRAAPGQLVVAVAAAGATYVDALIARGGYQIKPPLPYTPGTELAGVVREVGSNVDGVAAGDRILTFSLLGAFAEEVAVPATLAVPVPEAVDLTMAATIPQSYSTVAYEFLRRDPLRSGETVLVLGAGGGVGLAAVDMATSLGARVIAAASTADKLAAARGAGAAATINYANEDLKTRARELSDGGVDVVVDPVGGAYTEPALRALRWDGRYHVVGFTAGEIPRVPANLVLLNNRTMVGIEHGAWASRNPELQRELLGDVLARVADGRLHPVQPEVRPLADAPEVLQALLDRRVTGKVALLP